MKFLFRVPRAERERKRGERWGDPGGDRKTED